MWASFAGTMTLSASWCDLLNDDEFELEFMPILPLSAMD
jgi:hypothetical protein